MPGLLDLLSQTWPARMAQDAWSAVTLPRDVYQGKVDPLSADAIGRASNLAMLPMMGTFAGAPAGAHGSGPVRQGIRAYHRSPNDFQQFDNAFVGRTTDPGMMGQGHYLSTDARVAEAGPHRYETEVRLQNPLEVSMPAFGVDKTSLVQSGLGQQPRFPLDQITIGHRPISADEATALSNSLRAQGRDGVVLDYSPTGYRHKEIMALDANQIEIVKKYGWAGLAALTGVDAATLSASQQQQVAQ